MKISMTQDEAILVKEVLEAAINKFWLAPRDKVSSIDNCALRFSSEAAKRIVDKIDAELPVKKDGE